MKTTLILISLLVSSQIFARTIARVTSVKGNAFVFGSNGQSTSLGFGSKIPDLAEVMVEDGAGLSLVNNSEDIIHINGGSLVKFFNGSVELKNGQIWMDAKSKAGNIIHTSNSVAKYTEGQFIYSYDNVSGKTQLLVLTGGVKFSNALEPGLKVNVPSGFFSFVEQGYENGLPRTPTKVGLKSYKGMKSKFAHFDSIRNNDLDKVIGRKIASQVKKSPSRKIASVVTTDNGSKKGKLITFKTYSMKGRVPASTGGSALDYYKTHKQKEGKKFLPQKTGKVATVRHFGSQVMMKSVKKHKAASVDRKLHARKPASVPRVQQTQSSVFESSLKSNLNSNKKHSSEVNNLIDELRSYKKDFTKYY